MRWVTPQVLMAVFGGEERNLVKDTQGDCNLVFAHDRPMAWTVDDDLSKRWWR